MILTQQLWLNKATRYSLGQKVGEKMKYYLVIHCQLFDGATRQKKASPWALSLWINLAAVKFRIVFLAPKWGAQPHLVNLKGFFFDIFSFQHEPSTLTVPKKKPPLKRLYPNNEVISEPLKVELAFDALAKKKWSQGNTGDTEIPLKTHTQNQTSPQTCTWCFRC